MGLMQQVYDTYCAMESQYAGIYGKAKELSLIHISEPTRH